MVWGALIGLAGTAAAGALQGSAQKKANQKQEKQDQADRDAAQWQAHGGSINQQTVPYLNQNIMDTFGAFRGRGDYVDNAESNYLLDGALSLAVNRSSIPQNMMSGLFDNMSEAERTGQFSVNGQQINQYANELMQDPMMQMQMDSHGANVNRQLTENVLPQVQMGGISSGGLGGSRNAMSQALAMREAGDNIGSYRQQLAQGAQQQAQGALQGNIQTQMGLLGQQAQGIGQLQNAQQQDYNNVIGAGLMQRDIDQTQQSNIQNARDWELQNILQYGAGVQAQGSMGNYIPLPGEVPYHSPYSNSLYGGQ